MGWRRYFLGVLILALDACVVSFPLRVLRFACQETNESFVTQLIGQSLYWLKHIQSQPKNSAQKRLGNGRAILRYDSLSVDKQLTTFCTFIIPTPSDSTNQRRVPLLGLLDPER